MEIKEITDAIAKGIALIALSAAAGKADEVIERTQQVKKLLDAAFITAQTEVIKDVAGALHEDEDGTS